VDLFKATYILPQTVVSEGQALTRFIVAADFRSWVKVTENNRQNRTQETNFGTNTHFIAC
jgi:hypothetical protein